MEKNISDSVVNWSGCDATGISKLLTGIIRWYIRERTLSIKLRGKGREAAYLVAHEQVRNKKGLLMNDSSYSKRRAMT